MIQDTQKTQIVNSLRQATEIFKRCQAEYRIVGSTLIVALLKKIHRPIGDIDVILEYKDKDCVFEELQKQGFRLKRRRWSIFSWIEAEKKGQLGLTFLLLGNFAPHYFTYKFSRFAELRIAQKEIAPTRYSYAGLPFVGIPLLGVMAGIKRYFLNPKRKLDYTIVTQYIPTLNSQTVTEDINVYVLGVKIPYLYDFYSAFYNIYGGLRVLLGKKYEAWNA